MKKNRMHKKKSILLEYGVYIGILVFFLFIAPEFLVERVAVDGISMENTLFDKEHVLIEKVSRYFDGPKRFDIVVFTKDNGTIKKTYIKRVIGLPKETVQIIGNQIYIDGEILSETYGTTPMDIAGIAGEAVSLGEDEYFVLGDNRMVSVDSRQASVGVVKKEELDGVVVFRVAPWAAFGKVE